MLSSGNQLVVLYSHILERLQMIMEDHPHCRKATLTWPSALPSSAVPFRSIQTLATCRFKKLFTLLDLCVSSLRGGHANLLCIVPILTDDPRRESKWPCTAPLGCIAFLQPSRSLQTARAPGRLFLGLASAALSRHFACARRRDCQGQRQECDTCGVRTHADRSTRTCFWRLRPLGQSVMRLGAAGVVGRRRLERCASQSLYPLDGTHDRYSRAGLAISLHFPPAVGPHRFSNSPTVGLEPTTTRLRALRSTT